MNKVRAKFKVVSSEHSGNGQDIQNINLVAVVDDSYENKTFFKYTPAGSINLGVVNQAAAEFFQVEKELYVDFSEPNEASAVNTRKFSFGEKAVGLTFNPGGNEQVTSIKRKFADVIDDLNTLRSESTDSEVKRMASVAITEAQTAQMWAVKAVTWSK